MNARPAPPPLLADTLAVLLPSPQETLFLRACLSGGTRAGASWRDWFDAHPDIQAAVSGKGAIFKPLLPLLHAALAESGVTVDPATLAVLRAATLWEERRTKRIGEILSEILGLLARDAIAPVLLNGVALAATVYPRPAIRHCHEIDLWIPEGDIATARAALTGSGHFAARPTEKGPILALVHTDGLPINLFPVLTSSPLSPLPEVEMRKRTASFGIAGSSVAALSPADALIHLSAQLGSGVLREPTGWVGDAAHLARRLSAMEWDTVTRTAESSGLSLTLFAMLAYLRREIGIAIPDGIFAGVTTDASHSRKHDRDAALTGARKMQRRRLRAMVQHSGWRSRTEILRFLLFPSQAFLKNWCVERGLRWSPLWYLLRPLRRPAIKLGLMRKARPRTRGQR